jgi:hypothetical protein
LLNEWKKEKTKKSCQPFVNYARCNQFLNKFFSPQLIKFRCKLWCIMCEEKKGIIEWNCEGGSRCMFYIQLCDRNHKFKSSDSLCATCCVFQCDYCHGGYCDCDSDRTSCSVCQRAICGSCRCNYFSFDDDLCDDCFNLS